MKKRTKRIIAILLLVCTLFTCTAMAYKNDMPSRIKSMLKSQILFDDLAKFNDAVDTNDAAKIFQSVLEIYPDLVALSKKCAEEDTPTATILSDGNTILLSSAIVIAGGLIATSIIVVNKKKNEKQKC